MKAGYSVFTSTFKHNPECMEVINYQDNNEVVHIFWSNYTYCLMLKNKYTVGVWKIKKK